MKTFVLIAPSERLSKRVSRATEKDMLRESRSLPELRRWVETSKPGDLALLGDSPSTSTTIICLSGEGEKFDLELMLGERLA